MSKIVLDASALIALLQSESGAKIVEDRVDGALIASVNFGEAAQRQYRHGKSRAQFEELTSLLGLKVVAVDGVLALDAAEMREIGRAKGLSQADCICLALAKRESAVALTGDRKWLEIADAIIVEVQLIR